MQGLNPSKLAGYLVNPVSPGASALGSVVSEFGKHGGDAFRRHAMERVTHGGAPFLVASQAY